MGLEALRGLSFGSQVRTPPRDGGISPADLGLVALVAFLWALCFPMIFATLRSIIAGVGLLIPAFVLRLPLPRSLSVWLGLIGVGLTSTGLGFAGMFMASGSVGPGWRRCWPIPNR